VAIGTIRGSEARPNDFDRDFNPLQDHSGGRWLRVAKARWDGKPLPPVDLVRIGDIHFVRDGHHRISVARACGQRSIEAEVIVWRVEGPLPWEGKASASSQESVVATAYRQVRDRGAGLGRQLRLGLRSLLNASGLRQGAPQVSKA
jgi:hypothetical protein